MYDIIGDIHGHATLLKKLLKKLGYKIKNGTYSHRSSKAVFVGDFINRGPEVRESVTIIRSMVEAGNAYAILGNHELFALVKSVKDEQGNSILQKNLSGYYKTYKSFKLYKEEWKSHRRWMRSLPLFFENENFRVVHACWRDENILFLKEALKEGKIKKSFLKNAYLNPDSPEGRSLWQTTKGIYFEMPRDLGIRSSKKAYVRSFRMKWWEQPEGKTFNDISFESKMMLPEYTIPPEIVPKIDVYSEDEPIVFFGHYCRGNGPLLIRKNVCCVDSCVVGTKVLTAYSWDGEKKLKSKNLVQVS